MSLTGRGPQLRHGHDGEAQEGVRLADLLSLVPHLKQNLTAPARDLTEISVIRKKLTNKTKPECPIVAKDWFLEVLMFIHLEHLDTLMHLNKAEMTS